MEENKNNLIVRPLLPQNIDEAYRLANAFAQAEMLPKSYTGDEKQRTAKAFTAMQLGAEVGMSPMQAIQSIAVVNGMPSIWGDAQKALCLNSPLCEYIIETYEGEPFNDDFKAVCKTKRKGQAEVVEEFSVADAKKAGLWGKTGTWTAYPKRMIKYRARSFALRDAFPDVLKGLTHSAEEMEGLVDVTPQFTPKPLKEKKPRKEAKEINDILTAQIGGEIGGKIEEISEQPIENNADGVVIENAPVIKTAPPLSRLEAARASVVASKQPDLLPAEKIAPPAVSDAARKRADEIRYVILNCYNADKLREYVNDQQMHISVMPQELFQEISDAIGDMKDKFKISPAEDLMAG